LESFVFWCCAASLACLLVMASRRAFATAANVPSGYLER
jgi:hypothetical protein